MNLVNFLTVNNKDYLQSTLYWLSGIALFFYSIVLTISPAVRYQSWHVSYRWEHWVGLSVWAFSALFVNKFSQRKYKNRDPYILPIVALLSGIGLLTIFRLNVTFGFRQSIWLLLATGILLLGLFKSDWFLKVRFYKYLWLVFGLLLTALTFFLGIYPSGDGPQLWLNIGGVFLQPSEPLKILIIIYLAGYLADQWTLHRKIPALIVPTLVMFVITLLILIGQRDLGTASLFIALYAIFIFLATGKNRILLFSTILLFAAGFAGYHFFNVIQIRIDAWINPWIDPGGKSYQVIQSLQALAAGKFLGSGPGIGSPGLVPVALSDFIFSAIGEELGYLGALTIFSLYGFLAYRGIIIALRAKNQYQQLLAAGITILVSIQALLILGGNTRLLPLTGVTLPFISYGGSSLITSYFAIILLLWISQQQSYQTKIKLETKPYFLALNGILIGFIALSLATGWWSIIRSDSLLSRSDNFRKVINDRYVIRGNILDRRNQVLALTGGEKGNYTRILIDPSLSSTIGYANATYGLGGLELSMDSYLRGLQGLPSSKIIYNNLLYSQPPPGLDIRTSIDLSMQRNLSTSLMDQSGGAIIMNANTGEIFGIWTAPSFDANQITENWEKWREDPQSPLINRATQGSYPTGTLLTPFILAYYDVDGTRLSLNTTNDTCALALKSNQTLDFSVTMQNGCQSAFDAGLNLFKIEDVYPFLEKFGWTANPPFALPLAAPYSKEDDLKIEDLSKGISLSPFQIARASSIFSTSGYLPEPRIAMAVRTPNQGWVTLATEESVRIIDPLQVNTVAEQLARIDFPAWEVSSSAVEGEKIVSWYVSGTVPEWKGTPIVLVIVLENSKADIAQSIGHSLMASFTIANP